MIVQNQIGGGGYVKGDVIAAENLEEVYIDGDDWGYSSKLISEFVQVVDGDVGMSPYSPDGTLLGIPGWNSTGFVFDYNGDIVVRPYSNGHPASNSSTGFVERLICDSNGN